MPKKILKKNLSAKKKLPLKKEVTELSDEKIIDKTPKSNRFFYRAATFFDSFGRFFNNQKKFTRIFFILVAVSIIAALFFFFKFNQLKQNPTKEIDRQTKDIIAKVSKLVVLPKDEIPTIATVTEPEKLKDQPFFANAKKDDKVLIYTNYQKAILYRPSENKIIEIAPINLGQPLK